MIWRPCRKTPFQNGGTIQFTTFFSAFADEIHLSIAQTSQKKIHMGLAMLPLYSCKSKHHHRLLPELLANSLRVLPRRENTRSMRRSSCGLSTTSPHFFFLLAQGQPQAQSLDGASSGQAPWSGPAPVQGTGTSRLFFNASTKLSS